MNIRFLPFFGLLILSLNLNAIDTMVDAHAYLVKWLQNSEHNVEEKISFANAGCFVTRPNQSTQACQTILSLLHASKKQRTNDEQLCTETVHALEAAHVINSKNGTTQKTVLNKLCEHSGATLLGKIYLAKALVQPSSDQQTIVARQSVISALSHDDTLRTKLLELRKSYADGLTDATSLYHTNLSAADFSFADKTTTRLGTGSILSIPSTLSRLIKPITISSNLYLVAIGAGGVYEYVKTIKNDINRKTPISLVSQTYANCTLSAFSTVWYSLLTIRDVKEYYAGDRSKYDNVIKTCEYNHHIFKACLELRNLAETYPALKNIRSLDQINNINEKSSKDKDFKRFIDLLQKNPTQMWQYEQETLITLIHKYKDDLNCLYEIAGEAEAYLAIAETKRYFDSHDRLKMTITEFTDKNNTTLVAQNIWNPSLENDKAVPNSLVFDEIAKRHKILTGSNMGGKSTLIKAIIANLILSQTFGVAFAQEMKHLLVDQLLVSLNITDDTGKESLFEAEINRAARLLQILRNNPNKKSFVACDELFVGTAATNAGLAAKTVAQEIAKSNGISIFATHHGPVITNLGNNPDTPFANIKMDATQNEHGQTTYSYKCKDGVSQENIARKLFEERIGVPMAEK